MATLYTHQGENIRKNVQKRKRKFRILIGVLLCFLGILFVVLFAALYGFENYVLASLVLIGPVLVGVFVIYFEEKRIRLRKSQSKQKTRVAKNQDIETGIAFLDHYRFKVIPSWLFWGGIIAWIAFIAYLYFTKG